jgi:DNA polymerase (family X)
MPAGTRFDAFEISARLREIAGYLDLEGEPHRARAYRRAASTLDLLEDLERLVARHDLTTLPGVGPALAGVIVALAEHGTVGILERLRQRWPAAVLELSRLPRVGPLRARRLHEALGAADLEELAALCEAGKVRDVPGFGKISEQRMLEAIRNRHLEQGLLLLPEARELGAALASHLRACEAALRVEVCGPSRRWVEVVDRIALAAATEHPQALRERLGRHPWVVATRHEDEQRVQARLASGIECELHLSRPEAFGVAQIRATGSVGHVRELEREALAQGRVLDALSAGEEHEVYLQLGLPYLSPEVRDGTDELGAARAGERFELVTLQDLSGGVHAHTVYSDGKGTIEAMAAAAGARGLRFLTITDHSESATYAHGVDRTRLRAQWAELALVQQRVAPLLLRGAEVDILADGTLDYPAEVLDELQVVIASIHKRHRLDEDGMTRRLVSAMRQPWFKIWGHPLGRLLLRREPIACRLEEVLAAIGESRAAIEINGDPHRLDLAPELVRTAAAAGTSFVLSSDAHAPDQLDNVEYAVAMARRARLRRQDVLNALPPEEFAARVRPRRA